MSLIDGGVLTFAGGQTKESIARRVVSHGTCSIAVRQPPSCISLPQQLQWGTSAYELAP